MLFYFLIQFRLAKIKPISSLGISFTHSWLQEHDDQELTFNKHPLQEMAGYGATLSSQGWRYA